jgi:hypothetical protein
MSFISENNKQILMTLFLFLYTSSKVMLSTLLSIFVMDTCEFTTSLFKECTFIERISSMSKFNIFIFSFNFFTFGIFVGFYILEFYRETIFIKYLEIDNTLPNTNLKNEVENHPVIKKKLITVNNHYKKYSIFLVVVNLINFILSLILLYIMNSDLKTYINIFSNIFLVTDKLYSTMCMARQPVNDFVPHSAFIQENVIFNTIDSNYKIRHIPELNFNIEKYSEANSFKNIIEKYKLYNSRNSINSDITFGSCLSTPKNIPSTNSINKTNSINSMNFKNKKIINVRRSRFLYEDGVSKDEKTNENTLGVVEEIV